MRYAEINSIDMEFIFVSAFVGDNLIFVKIGIFWANKTIFSCQNYRLLVIFPTFVELAFTCHINNLDNKIERGINES